MVAQGLAYLPDNWWWREGPVEPGPAVVFDVDGVLADVTHRQHLVTGSKRDWHTFFELCTDDAPIHEVATMLSLLAAELTVVLLTARPARVQRKTRAWLDEHALRWDLLIMRDYGDYSYARDFKQYTVHELRQYGFELQLAFEDDPRNQDMFHAEGIPCVYIHSGYHL